MSIITTILATIVALEHFYIFYLESMATQSDATSRVFNMNKEELARPSVTSLFKNQGIYNALIGVFLIYGIYFSHSLEIVTIFVLFVIGAATYGALTADKKLDKANLEKLIAASRGMEIVFHMAFDDLSDEDQLEAIDWLSQAGVTRILTRAGVSGDSLEKRFAHYRRILEHATGKIEILPGGGIDMDNRQTFIDQLGVTQLHGTKVVF